MASIIENIVGDFSESDISEVFELSELISTFAGLYSSLLSYLS